MKILYEQSSFYLLQDGKKIKIANPELLPTLLVYTGYKDEIVWGYHDRYYLIRENDTFDLPKDLILGGVCHVCNRVGMRNCAHADTCGMNEIFLSKSSSPEIPDSSIIDAVEILRKHNLWRRGGDDPMTHPRELGIAIDTVVNYFKKHVGQ